MGVYNDVRESEHQASVVDRSLPLGFRRRGGGAWTHTKTAGTSTDLIATLGRFRIRLAGLA